MIIIFKLIFLCIFIILLLYITFIYSQNIEPFDMTRYNHKTTDEIQFRPCKLSSIPIELKKFCASRFGNMGKCQLIYEMSKQDLPENERYILNEGFEFKKNNPEFFDNPCETYIFSGNDTKEIHRNNENVYPVKNVADVNLEKKYGNPSHWASCFVPAENNIENITNAVGSQTNSSISFDTSQNLVSINDKKFYELEFNNTNIDNIKTQICPNITYKEDENNLLMLKLSLKENITENMMPFIVKDCEIIKYDPLNNSFISLEEDNIIRQDAIKSLFAITYNDNEVFYAPLNKNVSVVKMAKDVCDNPVIVSESNKHSIDFSLAHIGIKKTVIRNIRKYMISESKDEPNILEIRTSYQTNLSSELDKYITTIKDDIVTRREREKTRFIRMASTFKSNTIYKTLRYKANSIYKKCSGNIDNCIYNEITKKDISTLSSEFPNVKNKVLVDLKKYAKEYQFLNNVVSYITLLEYLHIKILNSGDNELIQLYENDNVNGIKNAEFYSIQSIKTRFLTVYSFIHSSQYFSKYARSINSMMYSIENEEQNIQRLKNVIDNALLVDIDNYKNRSLILSNFNNILYNYISQDNSIYIILD